jgi:hypothetical protein
MKSRAISYVSCLKMTGVSWAISIPIFRNWHDIEYKPTHAVTSDPEGGDRDVPWNVGHV